MVFLEIIKKYSNFVGFPIFLNGVCINTVEVSRELKQVSYNTSGLITVSLIMFGILIAPVNIP